MATDKAMVCGSDSEEDKDVDEANLPSREECESRCQMFAEVTGTDSALAMFYLQDRDWDLQRSISDYFADQDKDMPAGTEAALQLSTDNKKKKGSKTGAASRIGTGSCGNAVDPDCLTLGASVLQPEQEGTVRVLSWNIDGLDPDNLQSRTEGACAVLLQEHPEVIFLQEVVHRSLSIIRGRLESRYTVITGDLDAVNTPGAYFTAMLLRKDSVTVEKARVMDFPRSLMERDLMEVQCQVKGVPMVFLTSHLESTKEYHEERRHQLETAFNQMLASPQDRTVVFGGDLNLRDKELSGASAKPAGVYDLWECTGKRPEAKFTWDLMINDNKQLGTKFQPRCRFDRLYIRHCHGQGLDTSAAVEVKRETKPISSYFTGPENKKRSAVGSSHLGNDRDAGNSDLSRSENADKKPDIKKKIVSLKPVYFELVGIQRLASCRRFPSDHWGVLAHLQILDST